METVHHVRNEYDVKRGDACRNPSNAVDHASEVPLHSVP